MREKFEMSINDSLIGLQIFAAQKKIDDFSELFNKVLATKNVAIEAKPASEEGAAVKEGEDKQLE